jgi:lipopolysaccharide export system permease protein
MNILSRYIGLTLIKATLLILFVFIGFEIFILLATQLNSIGKGSYNIFQAIIYVFLILPQQTYLLFPIAGLLGILFGLSILANRSELIVMRTSGLSTLQILRYALQAGFILIIIMCFIGEIIGPKAKILAEKRKVIATSTAQALQTRSGLWLRQGENFYYIKTIYSAKYIADISRYVFKDQELVQTSFAKEGHYKDNAWQMSEVKESNISLQKITSKFIPETMWDLAINPHLLRISQNPPDEMSLKQLSEVIEYQKRNHLIGTNERIVFWQRIFQPISILVMMFLAVPFVFGALRSAKTSFRLVMGVIVGFAFYLSNQLFPPLSQVLNFPPIIAALLPALFFGFIGVILFRNI